MRKGKTSAFPAHGCIIRGEISTIMNIPGGMAPAPMPNRYIVAMLMDRIAASKVYKKEAYTNWSPLEYYLSAKEPAPLHKKTKKVLEKLLYMLAEEGEEKTFAYIRRRILPKRK